MTDFATLASQLAQQQSFIPNARAVFWSGGAARYANWNLAKECVEDYNGDPSTWDNINNGNGAIRYYTLENTQAGQFVDAARVYIGNGISQVEYEQLIAQASRQFAQSASGKVLALVNGGVGTGSFFYTQEFDLLMANPNVTAINSVAMTAWQTQLDYTCHRHIAGDDLTLPIKRESYTSRSAMSCKQIAQVAWRSYRRGR